MMRGSYTKDFYLVPTILLHNGDGIYHSIEFAWLKWFIGICWSKDEDYSTLFINRK